MSAKLLIVGFDAAEATLIERWADEGILPNTQRIRERSIGFALDSKMDVLPGAIWPEITSGISAEKGGIYYQPSQLHTGETRLRPIDDRDFDCSQTYWNAASCNGAKVCIIDQTHAPLDRTLNGVHIVDWGLHDRHFGFDTHPSSLQGEVKAKFGAYPIANCDHYAKNESARIRLLRELLDGSETKRKLLLHFLQGADWDLFSCTRAYFPAVLAAPLALPERLRCLGVLLEKKLERTVRFGKEKINQ